VNLDDEDDPVRAAEFDPVNVARVKGDVEKALRRSGCILPSGVIEALTMTVLEEALSTRRRMAFMVHCFAETYDGKIDAAKMERLETVLLVHHRDADNVGFLPDIDAI
jgi:hypothetical protein